MTKADSGLETDDASNEDRDGNEMSLEDALSKALGEPQSDAVEEDGQAETEGEADDDATDLEENQGDDETEELDENAADDDVDAAESGEPAEALSAPEHWPSARREAFGKLTREAQDILLSQVKDIEAGFTRKSQELP